MGGKVFFPKSEANATGRELRNRKKAARGGAFEKRSYSARSEVLRWCQLQLGREGRNKICALGILSGKGPRDRAHREGKRDVRKLPERNEETSSVFEQRERRRGEKEKRNPTPEILGAFSSRRRVRRPPANQLLQLAPLCYIQLLVPGSRNLCNSFLLDFPDRPSEPLLLHPLSVFLPFNSSTSTQSRTRDSLRHPPSFSPPPFCFLNLASSPPPAFFRGRKVSQATALQRLPPPPEDECCELLD